MQLFGTFSAPLLNSLQKVQRDVRPMVAVPDQQLVELMRQGDEEAFTALYRRRHAPVYRFAMQMTGNIVIAEDVTQEVFMALISHSGRFDAARGSVASFLFGIARNLVLRHLQKDKPALEIDPEFDDSLAADDDVHEDYSRRETVEQVRRAVLSLPELYREVIVLCDLQDTSYEDAAALLDCPIGTVRSRLNRGRSMLARKLRPESAAAVRSTL